MGIDVLKKVKGGAPKRRQKGDVGAANNAAPKHAPGGQFFVSSNWKKLLESRPTIAPRTASAATIKAPDGGAGENVVALDCEMVGVGPGGTRSALARVSLVDHEGRVLLDKFVRPDERVVDYRSKITGITAATLQRPGVLSEKVARQQAADLMHGKVVVGHSVNNDFQALFLSHPHELIRDTALFRPLRPPGREKKMPSLVSLAEHWLQIPNLHSGHHDSVEDARIALRLYRLKSKMWEKQLRCATTAASSAVAETRSSATVSAPASNVESTAKDDEDEEEQMDREDQDGSKGAPVQTCEPKKNKGKKARAREKRLAAVQGVAVRSNDARKGAHDANVGGVASVKRKLKKKR